MANNKLLRKVNTLYKDLKMVDQRVICNFFVSVDAVPIVQGNNFSPGRSLKDAGTIMIRHTRMESIRMAVEKPYWFMSQLPNASDAAVPIIFDPHIKPLALAC